MRAILVFVFLPLVWCYFVNYSGNVTLNNGNNDGYSYRYASLFGAGGILSYTSIEASGSYSQGSASGTAQGISGTFIALTQPYSYLYSFDTSATGNAGGGSVSSSEGFVGTVYTHLSEVDANGDIVQLFPLSDFTWTASAVIPATPTLQYATVTGSLAAHPGFNVSLTLVVSSVVGLVSTNTANVNAIVTPKSLETVVEIDGFPYINLTNSARLTVGVATGSSNLLANVSKVGNSYALSVGSGLSAVYVTFASQAYVDGKAKSIQIDTAVATNADLADLAGELISLLNVQVSRKLVNITFPAGSSSITYDPAAGAGSTPVAASSTNSGHTVYVAIESVILLSILVLLGIHL